MQERIDFLESQLRSKGPNEISDISLDRVTLPLMRKNKFFGNDQDDGDSFKAPEFDVDNDQWMSFFVEELKTRTIRGTSL